MYATLQEREKYDFSMRLDINWSDIISLNLPKEASFESLMKQGRMFYLIKILKGKWKEKGLIEQETKLEVHHPLEFPEPARIFVRVSDVNSMGFTLDCMILSLINNVETVLSTASTKMLLYDYKSSKIAALNEEFLELLHHFNERPLATV
ncbi:thioesterase family protein [Dyadobacter tibetensis]|uniref:thioesterase family protein n=1 Tax=Dyadobacter tibetensis TaxID=1211851 RepID=UPI000471C99F|nr:thioesterase family protein [Dyadobacter tibetensis]